MKFIISFIAILQLAFLSLALFKAGFKVLLLYPNKTKNPHKSQLTHKLSEP